jgi:hypothetical protein
VDNDPVSTWIGQTKVHIEETQTVESHVQCALVTRIVQVPATAANSTSEPRGFRSGNKLLRLADRRELGQGIEHPTDERS